MNDNNPQMDFASLHVTSAVCSGACPARLSIFFVCAGGSALHKNGLDGNQAARIAIHRLEQPLAPAFHALRRISRGVNRNGTPRIQRFPAQRESRSPIILTVSDGDPGSEALPALRGVLMINEAELSRLISSS